MMFEVILQLEANMFGWWAMMGYESYCFNVVEVQAQQTLSIWT